MRDLDLLERIIEDTFKPMLRNPINYCKEGITEFRRGLDMKTDIEKNDKEIIYSIELPGFSKEDIQIEIEENRLIVVAEKTIETKSTNEVLLKERTTNKVCRTFPLREDIAENEIKAKFENGLLIVTVPNKEIKTIEKKKIDIE